MIHGREPVTSPVLDVRHHDLERPGGVARRPDLAGLDTSQRQQPLAVECRHGVEGRRRLGLPRVEQHAAVDVADQDRGHLVRAGEQVEDELPELEVARVEVAVEALAERGRREDGELARRSLEAQADRALARHQQVGGVRDQDQHQRRDEHHHQARAEAAHRPGHCASAAAGRRSRGRSARLTGGSQLDAAACRTATVSGCTTSGSTGRSSARRVNAWRSTAARSRRLVVDCASRVMASSRASAKPVAFELPP